MCVVIIPIFVLYNFVQIKSFARIIIFSCLSFKKIFEKI